MKRDMRQINKVWQACNSFGEWHTFAIVGSGKNSFTVTLSAGAMADHYQRLVGQPYFRTWQFVAH